MNRSPRIRRSAARSAIAAATVMALTIVGLSAAPAAADEVTVYSLTTPGYSLQLVTSGDEFYEVTVTNLSASTQTFGLGATTRTPDAVEDLWTSPWTALANASQTELGPGLSYSTVVPHWAGARLVFVRDIFGAHQEIGSYSIPGVFTPFVVTGTEPNISIQWGQRLLVGSGIARAGETVHVSTAGLPGTNTQLWLLERAQATTNFGLSGSFTTPWDQDGGRYLGTASVVAGVLEADVLLPADLSAAAYVVIAGDPATDVWPAGPLVTFDDDAGFSAGSNLTIEPGAPRSTTLAGTNVNVAPVDSFGNAPVQFTFSQVTAPGSTTFTTSTTGPSSTAFTVNGATARYYDLATTATFTGPVTVCFQYDTTGLSPTGAEWQAFRLYHYTGGTWQDVTAPGATFGTLCGITNSFSPFVIGTPTAPPTWPFTGFLDPVSSTGLNTEFAGSIIPIRFRVGQDRGLNILAGGSPTSGLVPCGSTAAPISVQAAVPATSPSLSYVKATKTYWYFWKTNTSWAGTCRTFTLKLADGSVHTANFKFVKLSLGAILRALLKPTS